MGSQLNNIYTAPSFIDILDMNSEIHGSKTAVVISVDGKETSFSYSQLVTESQMAATALSTKVKAGDRVVLAMSTSPEFIRYFFGCLWIGAIPVPLPVEKSNGRFSRAKSVVEDCNPSLVVVKSKTEYEKMKDGFADTPALFCDETNLTSNAFPRIKMQIDPNQIALIQYTSGSTSQPKGVVITHANLIANIKMIQQGMQVTSDERVVSWLPLHHDMGLVGMLLSFVACGATTHIYPYQEFSRDPLSWLELLDSKKATLTGAPTFAFDVIEKRLRSKEDKKFNLSHLRLLYCGSERISLPSITKFYKRLETSKLSPNSFFPCYGLAEATLYISGDFANPFTQKLERNQFPTCGRVARELVVTIKNEDRILGNGEEGEICAYGPSISHGYWKDLQSKVTTGLLSVEKPAFLATGDLGVLRDQELFFTGRLKDIIKIRGSNYYPDDIEFAVESIDEFFSPNAVVALSSGSQEDEDGITIVAEINRNARDRDPKDIVAKIQMQLSSLGIQGHRFVIVSPLTLPKTSSGKKRRQVTSQMLHQGSLSVLFDSNSSTSHESPIDDMVSRLKLYAHSINLLLADERRTFPADFVNEMHDIGLLKLLIPKEFGGLGLTNAEFSQVGEKMGEIDLSIASLIGNHNTIGVLPILKSKNFVRRSEVLRTIASKGKIASFALTEPTAGSNPRGIASKVIRHENKLILNGEKLWIGNAPLAQFITVFANEVDDNGVDIGISAFLLQKDLHKYTIGEEQLTIGLKPMTQSRIMFSDTQVHESDRLSLPGEGLKLAFEVMEYARFGLAAASLGALKTGLNMAQSYTSERQVWTGLLSENPFIVASFKELQFKIETLQALIKKSSQIYDASGSLPNVLSLTCKILGGEWGFSGLDQCLQFCGGRGYTESFGIGRFWRDQRVIRIFEGPTETVAYQLGASVLRDPAMLDFGYGNKASDIIKIGTSFIQRWKSEFVNQAPEIININVGLFVSSMIAYACAADESQSSSNVNLVQLIENEASTAQLRIREQLSFLSNKVLSSKNNNYAAALTNRPLFDMWSGHNGFDLNALKVAPLKSRPQDGEVAIATKPAVAQSGVLENLETQLQTWLLQNIRMTTKVDLDRPITQYGVDSLMAYELLYFIEEKFGVLLPETTLLNKPSIKSLAAQIQSFNKGDHT